MFTSPDVNECMEDSHSCDEENQICYNTDGGYSCLCKDGFDFNVNGTQCEGNVCT